MSIQAPSVVNKAREVGGSLSPKDTITLIAFGFVAVVTMVSCYVMQEVNKQLESYSASLSESLIGRITSFSAAISEKVAFIFRQNKEEVIVESSGTPSSLPLSTSLLDEIRNSSYDQALEYMSSYPGILDKESIARAVASKARAIAQGLFKAASMETRLSGGFRDWSDAEFKKGPISDAARVRVRDYMCQFKKKLDRQFSSGMPIEVINVAITTEFLSFKSCKNTDSTDFCLSPTSVVRGGGPGDTSV